MLDRKMGEEGEDGGGGGKFVKCFGPLQLDEAL